MLLNKQQPRNADLLSSIGGVCGVFLGGAQSRPVLDTPKPSSLARMQPPSWDTYSYGEKAILPEELPRTGALILESRAIAPLMTWTGTAARFVETG